MNSSEQPLIVYVHVPKTAGSTINAALKSAHPKGHDHIENLMNQPGFLERCADWDWISGHITQPVFKSKLARIGRPIKYFASLREPVEQLASHINWLSEIRYRGERFFYNLSRDIQIISFEAGAVDYRNPSAVCAFLLKHRGLFLNNQATYVWGRDWEKMSLEARIAALQQFEVISDSSDLGAICQTLGIKLPSRRENVATYHYDTNILKSPEVQTFLKYHHSGDFELYDAAFRKR